MAPTRPRAFYRSALLAAVSAWLLAVGGFFGSIYLLTSPIACTKAQGPDVEYWRDYSRTVTQATTRATSSSDERTTATTRTADDVRTSTRATTRSSGGSEWLDSHEVHIVIADTGITASVIDRRSAATRPSTVSINTTNAAAASRSEGRTDTTATTRSSEDTTANAAVKNAITGDVKKGAIVTGANGDLTVDADGSITVKAVESRWQRRGPVSAVLGLVGLVLMFLPLRWLGSRTAAFGFILSGVAVFVLPDLLMWISLGVCSLVIAYPYLKRSLVFAKTAAFIEDWRSADMLPHEAAEFDRGLNAATGKFGKMFDKFLVEMKHGPGPAVVLDNVPLLPPTPTPYPDPATSIDPVPANTGVLPENSATAPVQE